MAEYNVRLDVYDWKTCDPSTRRSFDVVIAADVPDKEYWAVVMQAMKKAGLTKHNKEGKEVMEYSLLERAVVKTLDDKVLLAVPPASVR